MDVRIPFSVTSARSGGDVDQVSADGRGAGGVVAVGLIGFDDGQVGIGQERVIPSHREQLLLPGWGGVELADAPHDEPGGDLVAACFERGVPGFGDRYR
jgi:hypothetical protein